MVSHTQLAASQVALDTGNLYLSEQKLLYLMFKTLRRHRSQRYFTEGLAEVKLSPCVGC